MRIPQTDVQAQAAYVAEVAIKAVAEMMHSTQFLGGKWITEFEQVLMDYYGVKHVIACDSGTAALMSTMHATGVRDGVPFASPSMTFISVAEVAHFLGALPCWRDLDASCKWLMKDEVLKNRSVVIPVALYGRHIPPGRYANFPVVIVDAAQAHGQPFNKRWAAMCLSFYPGKIVGAFGDGGAVLTNDDQIAVGVRAFINHGRAPGEKWSHRRYGLNCRMDAFQARILTIKYAFLDDWLDGRRRVANWYAQILRDSPHFLHVPEAIPEHSFHLYVVLLANGIDRKTVWECLRKKGIGAGIHYPIPVHQQLLYVGTGNFMVTNMLADRCLSLPIYPEMAECDVEQVCEVLVDTCGKHSEKPQFSLWSLQF